MLRTIHGVGEMMTQMVMSRGVPHSLPESSPSLRYGKGHLLPDNEDVMVMDTKLKIIEILQVSAPYWTRLILVWFAVTHLIFFVLFPVHPEREAGLQDHLPAVHLQEGIWGQERRRRLLLGGRHPPDDA